MTITLAYKKILKGKKFETQRRTLGQGSKSLIFISNSRLSSSEHQKFKLQYTNLCEIVTSVIYRFCGDLKKKQV